MAYNLMTNSFESFSKFLQECTKCMEVSEDSNKILKKIQKYFSQVDEEIKKGRQLIKYLAASSLKISEGSVYIVIKEVIDYFKDRRAGSKKVNEAHRVKLEKYLEVTTLIGCTFSFKFHFKLVASSFLIMHCRRLIKKLRSFRPKKLILMMKMNQITSWSVS